MNTDTYTKFILTVIAVCLTILVVRDLDIIPSVHANESLSNGSVQGTNYAWVPVHSDGAINVRVTEIEEPMDVNIEEIGGRWVRGGATALPVKVKD